MEHQATNSHILAKLLTSLMQREEFVVFRPNIGEDQGWGSTTSTTFQRELISAGNRYQLSIAAINPEKNNVVAVWLTGSKYTDVLNIMGLMLAGYIPQLFSSYYPNAEVVWDLMTKSGAIALVYDDEFSDRIIACRVPTLRASAVALSAEGPTTSPISLPFASESDTALIIQSSGTTSGTPKLIPVTHGWAASFMIEKYPGTLKQGKYDDLNVTNTLGNLAHVGSITAFMAAIYNGFCTVHSPPMNGPTSQYISMIKTCGVNRLVLYAPFLSSHIKEAKKDASVAAVFASCRQILYTGVSLPKEDADWASQNGFPITEMYGASETAPLMTSVIGTDPSARLLRFIPGVTAAALVPCSLSSSGLEEHDEETLFEMICYPGKKDSPHTSLFTSKDGVFHTEDIFEEVSPGLYRFRGRKGDWVKTLNGFCDAKTMEDNIRQTCTDILHDVAVVGDNWPLPTVFIEALPTTKLAANETPALVDKIIARNSSFNERLFKFERIEDPRRILVVPYGTLPRTKEKGNVRRNAIAKLFVEELNAVFA